MIGFEGSTRERDAPAARIGELIRRAKDYDREAFADLYSLTIVPVHRYVSARVGTVEEAEELTQEVFLAALRGIRTLRAEDESGLFAWLFQIARHKLADQLRQRYRRPLAPLEEAERLEGAGPPPEMLAEANEECAELRLALGQLTPEQREVIVCKYVLGFDNDRTGRIVGKNANAVNQLHHRALGSLHRLLTKKDNRK